MLICQVQDKCVSTIKNEALQGYSLMIVQKINKDGKKTGELIVAVDTLGCSIGETVIIVTGSSAKAALTDKNSPVDAVIIGIVDSL